MDTEFTLFVSHGQIAVFDSTLDQPFNDWNDLHVQQGFTWRPESVSFRTLLDGGNMEVLVRVTDHWTRANDAAAQIEVPFSVAAHGQVSVASISSEEFLHIQPGLYQLAYEAKDDGIVLTLWRSAPSMFRIHRVGPQARSGEILSITAEPA